MDNYINMQEVVSEETYNWYKTLPEAKLTMTKVEKMIYLFIRGLENNNESDISTAREIYREVSRTNDEGSFFFDIDHISPHIRKDMIGIIRKVHDLDKLKYKKVDIAVFSDGMFIFDTYNFHNPNSDNEPRIMLHELKSVLSNRTSLIEYLRGTTSYEPINRKITENSHITIMQLGYGLVERIHESTPAGLHSYTPVYPFKFNPVDPVSARVEITLNIKETEGVMGSVIKLKEE